MRQYVTIHIGNTYISYHKLTYLKRLNPAKSKMIKTIVCLSGSLSRLFIWMVQGDCMLAGCPDGFDDIYLSEPSTCSGCFCIFVPRICLK